LAWGFERPTNTIKFTPLEVLSESRDLENIKPFGALARRLFNE